MRKWCDDSAQHLGSVWCHAYNKVRHVGKSTCKCHTIHCRPAPHHCPLDRARASAVPQLSNLNRLRSLSNPAPMARLAAHLLRRQHGLVRATQLVAHTSGYQRQAVWLSTNSSAAPFLSPSPSTPPQPPLTTFPSTTLAVTYNQTGDPSTVLSVTRQPLPSQLQSDELLVRYLASPINPSDLNMVEGTYPLAPASLPATAGNEGVAVIEAVGSAVNDYQPGQWVNPVRPTLGTWRQYAVLRAVDVELVPAGLTSHQAAVLSVNPCTAYRLLHDIVRLPEGAVVAQNAATSAVGQSVIQIARQLGIATINFIRPRDTASSTRTTVDHLRSLGATHVVVEDDTLRTALSSLPPAALALNGIGGASSATLLGTLKGTLGGGVHVTYGGMSRRPVTVGSGQLIFDDVTLKGFWMSRWNQLNERTAERRHMRQAVSAWMRDGSLRLNVREVELNTEGVAGIQHALQYNAEPFKLKKVVLAFPTPPHTDNA